MKRYDILYEENCQQLEEIEKKMYPQLNIKSTNASFFIFGNISLIFLFRIMPTRKFMEEEIIKDEEELEKLEVEYGTDNDDP